LDRSSGLRELCADNREAFGADVLIASDGPRLAEERPTIYLGCRGAYPIDLWIEAREGGHHSGNWGGLLSNPAVQLVHALASIVGPTGQIRVSALVPDEIPESVKRALADCEVASGPGEPAIDRNWGGPGLTLAEKVYAWCTFEILAMSAGILTTPSTPSRRAPRRGRRSGSSRASTLLHFSPRCDAISIATASPWSRSPRPATRFSTPRASIPSSPRRNGPRPQ
jgi:hypothetical protein